MKSYFSLLFFFTVISIQAQKNQAYFTEKPTLTPDGSNIIFSYEGDLWKVSSNGGDAYRITAMEGVETSPSVSPDGKWLAFSSNQYGNNDVYIMPLKGGQIKQLTFHQGNDMVSSWNWDSKTINFTSNRYNNVTSYTINKEGGTPKRTFPHYFNTVHNLVQHPKTKDLYFNESWESGRFAHRKRYKGDYNPDIKSYNLKTKQFKKHTSYRGKDFATTIDKKGNIYFKSDEYKGEYNLYTFKNGKKKRLTSFSTAIMWPKVSANGKKIVFRRDYQLYVYDVEKKSAKKLKININNNTTLNKNQSFNVKGNISYFDISLDGKKMAFVSRGKLFISDVKGKFVREITTKATEAVREVKWLKNNSSLLYSRSVNGYYNWFVVNLKDDAKAKQLTESKMNNRQITLNKDRTKGVYLRGRNGIYIIDLNTLKSNLIVKDELWGFYNANPYFSPDDQYVLYTARRNFEEDIFVYNVKTKKSTNLTKTKVSESVPSWSPDGKYIYFSSDRTKPGFPTGRVQTKIYQMALDKYEKPFKSDKVDELFAEKKSDKEKKDKKKEDKKVTVEINKKGLMNRLTRIGPWFGSQNNLDVIQDGKKTHILYTSNHAEGKTTLWKTTLEPFEKDKTVKVGKTPVFGFQLVSNGKKHYVLSRGNIYTLNLGANKLKTVAINYSFNKSLSDEFNQMYYDAWAGFEQSFYDEKFHGQDWEKLRDRYAKFLPYISSRRNLRRIFNDMLGELNTSHFGLNSNGKEERVYHGTRSLATGIIFNNKNPYIIERIVAESPVDVKGKDLRKGDKLVAVNGTKIDENKNREFYFTNPKSVSEMQLTFSRNKKNFTVNVHPTSYFAIKTLMYDEWQDENQSYVDKKSNNQIAYVHMKNMTNTELVKFKQDLMSNEANKKGLILDLRYNTGGNVHDAVLNFLRQKQYLQWKYREGKLGSQSNVSYGNKPIVLLINEQSLSDAEMTAAGFKELKIGTIVGTETYRWIIFTTSGFLVDGSYRMPSWGCYTLDGKDLELEGVKPDIYVGKNFKDRLQKNTPQLDKAINLILKQIR